MFTHVETQHIVAAKNPPIRQGATLTSEVGLSNWRTWLIAVETLAMAVFKYAAQRGGHPDD